MWVSFLKPVWDSGCKCNLCLSCTIRFLCSLCMWHSSVPVSFRIVCVFSLAECKSWSWWLTAVWCRNFRKSTRSAGDHQKCTPTSIWHCKYVGIVEHNNAFHRKASIPGQIYTVWWNGVYPHCDRSNSDLLHITADNAVWSLHLSACFAKPKI